MNPGAGFWVALKVACNKKASAENIRDSFSLHPGANPYGLEPPLLLSFDTNPEVPVSNF